MQNAERAIGARKLSSPPTQAQAYVLTVQRGHVAGLHSRSEIASSLYGMRSLIISPN